MLPLQVAEIDDLSSIFGAAKQKANKIKIINNTITY